MRVSLQVVVGGLGVLLWVTMAAATIMWTASGVIEEEPNALGAVALGGWIVIGATILFAAACSLHHIVSLWDRNPSFTIRLPRRNKVPTAKAVKE